MSLCVGRRSVPDCAQYLVAGINYDPALGEKEKNIDEQYALAEQAARNGARLIALTEMATTGYCWYNRAEVAPYVETIPGATTDRFGELAARYDCWIAVGLPEVDPHTGLYYNSAALIGPQGVVGVHRKSHLFIGDPKWARQGNLDHQVFATPIGNIAMLVCMDSMFMETVRIQGLRNADVIVLLGNWLGEKTPSPFWLTRAFENGVYLLACDRGGQERAIRFNGGTVLVDPDGQIISRTDEAPNIVYGEVDIPKARTKTFAHGGHKFLERHPQEYVDVLHDPYLWNPLNYFKLYGHDPLPLGKSSSVSVAQVYASSGAVEANLTMIAEKAAQAAAEDSELLVFPELVLTGLPVDPNQAGALAETIPGPSVERLVAIAADCRIHMIVGLIERDGVTFYNSAVLVGPDGLIGKYRKTHLSAVDAGWATPGNMGFPHFNIGVGRVGILIGHDALFPETARILALNGVDLICCPSAMTAPKPYQYLPPGKDPKPLQWHLWRIRGGENACYLAFANMVGASPFGSFFGCSGLFQADAFARPKIEFVLSESEEEVGTGIIDTSDSQGAAFPTGAVRRKDFVCMRQPHWYDQILEPFPPVVAYAVQGAGDEAVR